MLFRTDQGRLFLFFCAASWYNENEFKGIFKKRLFAYRRKSSMVQEICRDIVLLARKAEPAGLEDLPIAADLLDTLKAHEEECVGMAANMIGINKRIIAFDDNGTHRVMLNPEILKRSGPYEAEEGCLSLTGTRPARRWNSIKVQYQNEQLQTRMKTFTGWTAQIIQHEIDHCEGIII